jgi:CubicO group peptidase (beta-lactamase class C family)
MTLVRLSIALAATVVGLQGCDGTTEPVAANITEFEGRLETLRELARIPGISAAIAVDQRVAWAKGFGIADVAGSRLAADTTAYHLASLTKPFASTVLLQLVQEDRLSLDEPVSTFGISIGSPGAVRVRHLLSHTSSGTPGTQFIYDGDRFGLLDAVIQQVAGKSFAEALQERIIGPLALRHAAPNPLSSAFAVSGFDRTVYERNLARGYRTAGSNQVVTQYPSYFGTAAGLTASVIDVARFSMALDSDALLEPATKAIAFTPAVTPIGATLPYALGWFVTSYRGTRVIWHYGLWTAISSLIIKVPDRGLTFVLLANTEALSAPYPLGSGQLEKSPWARAFLDAYGVGDAELPPP